MSVTLEIAKIKNYCRSKLKINKDDMIISYFLQTREARGIRMQLKNNSVREKNVLTSMTLDDHSLQKVETAREFRILTN